MTVDDHDRTVGHVPAVDVGESEKRWNHDLSNLVLAARLRLDVLRANIDPSARAAHLDAIEACLERATEILKASDTE